MKPLTEEQQENIENYLGINGGASMKVNLDKVAGVKLKDNREDEDWTSIIGEVETKRAKEFDLQQTLLSAFKGYEKKELYWVNVMLKNGYEIKFLTTKPISEDN